MVDVRSDQQCKLQDIDEVRQKLHDKIMKLERPKYFYAYPPKDAYKPFTDSKAVSQSWTTVAGPVNIYVHIPYCDYKCHYCKLFSIMSNSAETSEQYVSALLRESNLVGNCINKDSVEIASIYLGGGTPTILSTKQLETILNHFSNEFYINNNLEIGIESTPTNISKDKCRELVGLGFNRISIGIQSFITNELYAAGRKYNSDTAYKIISTAIESGFRNVNIDLIFGLAEQTFETWQKSLEIAVELGITTITLYPLVIQNRKYYQEINSNIANGANLYKMYDFAVVFLESNGYIQQTQINFVKGGGGCQYEANESVGIPTMGLGAGSRSYTQYLHYTNDDYVNKTSSRDIIEAYLKINDEIPVRSAVILNKEEIKRRYIMYHLLFQGINKEEYFIHFNELIENRFFNEFKVLEEGNYINNNNSSITLTKIGRKYSSIIASLFYSSENEKYLPF
ncbi:oxygen-independent coproporphyrinogen-3 oxidase [Sporomusaceae bacterium BoRhaA]|uniref:coproporphyrinogen-III oxidase family protein n=1 Tax=Pelorhabdus rhamnosifermentans TaxID=2772457 RepID=UPI001C060C23|nr:radical SAM protein [Pelorhabdus rhamnosifermentans]MBU2703930.1 oxygen-independent coproporphyrinogen-3 oxidase [Pelorhabdus rhamnosifermentans]